MSLLTTDDIAKYLINIGLLDSGGGLKLNVTPKTADYTIVSGTDPSGTIFTNRAAVATVIFTLPAPSLALKGTFYDFVGVADFTITVKTATADTFILLNDIAADSLSMQTGGALIAGAMRAVCDGTSWIGFGQAVGVTFTVAT